MDFFNEIWLTISKNRSRSLLTGFGVFWGMMILLALVSMGDSLKSAVWSHVEGLATNSTFIGTSATSLPYKGLQKGRQWDIVNSDLPVIRREAPSADVVSAVSFKGEWDNNVRYGDRKGSYSILGVSPDFPKVMYIPILYGRNVNDIDLGEELLLSSAMLRHGEQVLLDDMTVDDIRRELNIDITIVESDGYELLNAILA